jgi:hypothetical protein
MHHPLAPLAFAPSQSYGYYLSSQKPNRRRHITISLFSGRDLLGLINELDFQLFVIGSLTLAESFLSFSIYRAEKGEDQVEKFPNESHS